MVARHGEHNFWCIHGKGLDGGAVERYKVGGCDVEEDRNVENDEPPRVSERWY